jgi:hypothetical protein
VALGALAGGRLSLASRAGLDVLFDQAVSDLVADLLGRRLEVREVEALGEPLGEEFAGDLMRVFSHAAPKLEKPSLSILAHVANSSWVRTNCHGRSSGHPTP